MWDNVHRYDAGDNQGISLTLVIHVHIHTSWVNEDHPNESYDNLWNL